MEITGPNGMMLDRQTFEHGSTDPVLEVKPPLPGWHIIRATSTGLGSPVAFEAPVTYKAPQQLGED